MANAGILYDKYTVIQKLQKRGFSHEQAEVVGEVLTEADLSSPATIARMKAVAPQVRGAEPAHRYYDEIARQPNAKRRLTSALPAPLPIQNP